ncbi:MAG: hypothetical protein IJZ29_02440 [Clostridia bacterium]|nr:hypothetical protein [Clostridia bacterium]
MVKFKDKKLSKKERKLQEKLKAELIYNNLSDEEKQMIDVYSKEQKYISYAQYGILGIMTAVALYHGNDLLNGCFYDTTLTAFQNLQYIMAVSVESVFTETQTTVGRIISILIPFSLSSKLDNNIKILKTRKNNILGIEAKKSATEKFFEYLAKRNLRIQENQTQNTQSNNQASIINVQEDEEELIVH